MGDQELLDLIDSLERVVAYLAAGRSDLIGVPVPVPDPVPPPPVIDAPED